MIYFTADLHFNHNKEFIYRPRGFGSVYEMNQTILENINNIVKEDDTLYILGDLTLGNHAEGMKWLQRIICKDIRIILGNHDTDMRILYYHDYLPNVTDLKFADRFNYKKYHFYLSHYPTITSNLDYDKPLKMRTLNLHGHTHSKEKFYNNNPLMYNVAVDAHDNKPVSIEQIIEDIKQKFKETPREEDIRINIEPYISFLDNLRVLEGK